MQFFALQLQELGQPPKELAGDAVSVHLSRFMGNGTFDHNEFHFVDVLDFSLQYIFPTSRMPLTLRTQIKQC